MLTGLDMPTYSESAELGAKGVRMVSDAVEDEFHWIFRVKEKADIGIDAEIERVNDSRKSTGQLLAVQIKCGQSFFKETCDVGYVFRCSKEKINYWLNLSLPVILCLCDDVNGIVYWSHITVDTILRLKYGYKIVVPFNNKLIEVNQYKLEWVLDSAPQIEDIAQAAVFRYLSERYNQNIVICPEIEAPRDFNGLSYLAKINDNLFLIGIVTDKYGLFDIDDVKGKIESYNRNRTSFGWSEDFKSKLLLCFVSESINHLQLTIDILEMLQKNEAIVTYDRLHLNKKNICADLVREDGAEIWFFDSYGNIDEGQIFSTHRF